MHPSHRAATLATNDGGGMAGLEKSFSGWSADPDDRLVYQARALACAASGPLGFMCPVRPAILPVAWARLRSHLTTRVYPARGRGLAHARHRRATDPIYPEATSPSGA